MRAPPTIGRPPAQTGAAEQNGTPSATRVHFGTPSATRVHFGTPSATRVHFGTPSGGGVPSGPGHPAAATGTDRGGRGRIGLWIGLSVHAHLAAGLALAAFPGLFDFAPPAPLPSLSVELVAAPGLPGARTPDQEARRAGAAETPARTGEDIPDADNWPKATPEAAPPEQSEKPPEQSEKPPEQSEKKDTREPREETRTAETAPPQAAPPKTEPPRAEPPKAEPPPSPRKPPQEAAPRETRPETPPPRSTRRAETRPPGATDPRRPAPRNAAPKTPEGPAGRGQAGGPPAGELVEPRFRPGSGGNPLPAYPDRARFNGWEGRVLLHVTVSETGQPDRVRIESSSGYGLLDRAAVDAVRRWRFEPGRRGGTPTRATVLVPIRFALR